METWEVAGVTIILGPLSLALISLTYVAFREYVRDMRRRRKGLGPHPGYNFWGAVAERRHRQSRIGQRKRETEDDVRRYIEELLSKFIEQSKPSQRDPSREKKIIS